MPMAIRKINGINRIFILFMLGGVNNPPNKRETASHAKKTKLFWNLFAFEKKFSDNNLTNPMTKNGRLNKNI